ncbi:MAG TPA: thioredoxin domain-containing protein [Candidatus Limnocylindrales bacterium]|nr:thioredoxin domain-containing protein [Candidatus Limnocylindrales bacterium]
MRRLLCLLLIAGCYKTVRDPAVDRRLADIEAKLIEQDKQLEALRSRGDSTELSLLAQQIAELSAKVAELADKVAKAPPPRRPSRAPDPALTYSVPLGASPVVGSPKAKVTIVMAFEFACPYCRKAWDTVDALQKKYGKDLRVAYKQFIIHPTRATAPAYAACAAAKQGKWRKLADLMWQKAFEAQNFDPQNVESIAKEAGLDMTRYATDTAGACVQEIGDDQALLKKLAINATPSFFINGRFIAGALAQEKFEALIDEELAKATEAQKKGTKPERYYEDVILATGLTEVPAPGP